MYIEVREGCSEGDYDYITEYQGDGRCVEVREGCSEGGYITSMAADDLCGV